MNEVRHRLLVEMCKKCTFYGEIYNLGGCTSPHQEIFFYHPVNAVLTCKGQWFKPLRNKK